MTLPVLSAEVDSVPSQPSGTLDNPVAEVPLTPACSPEPQRTQLTVGEDAGGRSDTESLGPAEEFAFLVSGTGIVHVCSSASRTACGLWSEKFRMVYELPARPRLCKHRACHLALLSA